MQFVQGDLNLHIYHTLHDTLTLTTLGLFSRRQMWYFLFFPVNRILHFMQIVSIGDALHEMSNPVFWENKNNVIYWKIYPF